MEFKHASVLLEESVEGLNIHPAGTYVDGTMGGGGHSLEIVRRLTTGHLIGIDQDQEALNAAKERLKDYADKVTFVKDNFVNIRSILAELGIEKVLITCIRGNEGSRRTILKNGGVYESTVYEPEEGEYLERYWIRLSE